MLTHFSLNQLRKSFFADHVPPFALYHLAAHPFAYADGYTSNLRLAWAMAFAHNAGLAA
jgi:hypothetical protein